MVTVDRRERGPDRRSSRLKPLNRLLLELPSSELGRFLERAELLDLPVGALLQEVQEPATHAYFPETGVGSVVAVMDDGSMTEAASIGKEGFFGSTLVVGSDRSVTRSVWQVPGEAYRIAAADLRELLVDGRLHGILLRSLQDAMDQMSQVAGCNRRHPLSARAARWLLMTQDRVPDGEFKLTHEFLATMLGADRPRVTLAAKALQEAGLIQYRRGVVRVTDREGLEEAACECYTILARIFPGGRA
jgi:CRP-like cAMP-binding protein